jgi:hypothetical protein
LAALGSYDEEAFGLGHPAFVAEAKYLAQEAAAGNTEALHTCLSILIETIESDPEDLSDWTIDQSRLGPSLLSLRDLDRCQVNA